MASHMSTFTGMADLVGSWAVREACFVITPFASVVAAVNCRMVFDPPMPPPTVKI